MVRQKTGFLSELNINWRKYSQFFTKIEVESKQKLLLVGNVSDQLYILEKGIIRMGFEKDNKDITVQFFFENELATSFESFYGARSSKYFLETMEPCTIYCLTKKDLDHLHLNEPEIALMSHSIILSRLTSYANQLIEHISESPEERFNNLIAKNPNIFMRVPQRHIATYLGITNVSLSRIKARKISPIMKSPTNDLYLG
jgi:CRP-like cAMP-binding protein